jgi:hypothetical protein
MKVRLAFLRLMLIVVAVTGLPCSSSLFMPWESTVASATRLGIEGVPQTPSPINEYWLRMMLVLRVLVGVFYFVAALNPVKYKSIMPILGWGMVFVGVAAGYHGFRLGLPSWTFYSDIVICGVCGLGIIWLSKRI